MVQRILTRMNARTLRSAAWAMLLVVLLPPALLAARKKAEAVPGPPDLLMDGGRKLSFERVFSSERDMRGKPGFWKKLVDVVAGEPEYKAMVRPYGIAVDSHGRVIVTDPGMGGVHIFDAEQHKYKFLERKDKGKDAMRMPQDVALDAKDNIYVTDSSVGKVFVFEPSGKYKGVFGSLKGGEGYFKRATGIAIDRETQQIYVTDTLRDKVFILDANGQVLKSFGGHGEKDGEFNLPTELMIRNEVVAVVDAMNFRVQTFDRKGNFQSGFGNLGDSEESLFRPKGISLDSENHIYVVEGLSGTVQVFDREGQLLYFFGRRGRGLGEFQLPAGVFIDPNDRVYVVDSYNRRVQVFQYHGVKLSAQGAKP